MIPPCRMRLRPRRTPPEVAKIMLSVSSEEFSLFKALSVQSRMVRCPIRAAAPHKSKNGQRAQNDASLMPSVS